MNFRDRTPEERTQIAKKGGEARARQRQEAAALKDPSGNKQYAPGPTLAKALDTISRLLDSELPDGEPNLEDRALGVYLLTQLFKIRPGQRREAIALVAQVRPKLTQAALGSPRPWEERDRLLDFERARAKLRALCQAGRVSLDELPPGVLEELGGAR